MPNLTLDNALDHNAKPIKVGDKIVSLSVSESKAWYEKTPTEENEIANKKYVDDSMGVPDTSTYYYDIKFSSYYTTVTANLVPLNGTIIEKATSTSSNEYVAWIAPYNGTIEKAFFRSEIAQSGTFDVETIYSADGVELPATLNMRYRDGSMSIADDTTYEANFTGSLDNGDNTIVKGRLYSLKVTTPSASYDTNITFIFKWDVTS